ncbi:MAG: iron-sulfur cluster assembly accessory protein [Candidatus Riflebacteria bacterium]|nr:iron-sulfur cluster assembly accessory protein [Candidatus Riflebacteria bacterium]
MINLTRSAIQKVQEFLSQDQTLQGKFLRVFVEAGDCSGMRFGMTFDDERPGDQVSMCDGFKVLIDEESSRHLDGALVDYVDGKDGAGFAISNPKAKSCCCDHDCH